MAGGPIALRLPLLPSCKKRTITTKQGDPIEVGTESVDVEAEEVTGPERDALYARQVARFASFGDYEKATARKIPVIRLTRRN